jgi:hypothetical protein
VATAVAARACREGLTGGIGEHEVADRVRRKIWLPAYAPYERVNGGRRGRAHWPVLCHFLLPFSFGSDYKGASN